MPLFDNLNEKRKELQTKAQEAIDTNAPKVKKFVETKAPKVGDKIKRTKDKVQDTIENKMSEADRKKQEEDYKKHTPIFKEEMKDIDLKFERIIRVIDHDKREEDERYEGSIGLIETIDETKVKTFYYRYASELGVYFYPRLQPGVFVKDPCFPYKFINIDQYYDYMNEVRVNELTTLAQSLGARHVKISYKVSSSDASNTSGDIGGALKKLGNFDGSFDMDKSSVKQQEILAETTFSANGTNKIEIPNLLYFKGESDIMALIDMVRSGTSRLESRTYSLHASSSSGISFKEALDIAATIKKIGFSEDFERKSRIEKDAILEYTIIF